MATRNSSVSWPSLKRLQSQLSTSELQPTQSRYYAQPPTQDCEPIRRSLAPFVCNTVWSKFDEAETWDRPNIHLDIHAGSGQLATPFTTTHTRFERLCVEAGFTASFLRKLRPKSAMFEYRLHYSGSQGEKTPTALEIAVSTYENDDFLGLFRYDIQEKQIHGILFFKLLDNINKTPLSFMDFKNFLTDRIEFLDQHPLMVVNAMLEFVQKRGQEFVRWRITLYNEEARLGVTRKVDFLKTNGYPEVSYKYGLLNAGLATLGNAIADSELSASTIQFLATEFSKLLKICEAVERQGQDPMPFPSEQQQEVDGLIARTELYLRHMKMSQDSLRGLTAVLYNRINQRESLSMKTIAVVTLMFLPSTLVSGIFSTGIFDFQGSENQGHLRVSKYWPTFSLICVVLTVITLIFWLCWYKWGHYLLDKLGKPQTDLNIGRSRELQVPDEILLRSEQRKASDPLALPITMLLGDDDPQIKNRRAQLLSTPTPISQV